MDDGALAVAMQTDGKIVTAGRKTITGSNFDFALIRYNTDGSLDNTFGNGGIVTTDFGGGSQSWDIARSLVIQPDGRIIVAGVINGLRYALARYNSNGSLDQSFGGGGVYILSFTLDAGAWAIALQPDGKIVTAGSTYAGPSGGDIVVVRQLPDGSLDTTFGTGGKVITTVGAWDDVAHSLAIQSDGKIVVAGSSANGINNSTNDDFAVARYNSDGSLDSSFGGTGIVKTALSPLIDVANNVNIQPDGKIIVTGSAGYSFPDGNSDVTILRYNADGSLDNGFGNGGKVITNITNTYDTGWAAQLQPDGKIVVGAEANYNTAVMRYNADGSLDTCFGTNGMTINSFGIARDGVYAVAIQPNGRIIAAGGSYGGTGSSALDFTITRYLSDGDPAPTATATATATNTPTATVTFTPTPTNTATFTPTDTPTATFTPTSTSTAIFTPTATETATNTPMNTPTVTPTPPAVINGTVTYGNAIGSPATRFVSNALIDGTGSVAVSTQTGFSDGGYSLSGFGSGSYTVTPTKTAGVNGISSFDAAKIAQHVSGTATLTANQLLVADVSNNGLISSFDAAQIAKYVASAPPYGITGTWKFLPASRSYPSISSDMSGEDYTALLMGEVSGNWTNPGARSARNRQLSVGTSQENNITIELPQISVPADKEIILPVNIQGAANKEIISYEFDLRYDPAVIQPLEDPVDLTGTASRGLSAVVNANEPGLLRVVVYGALPIYENGLLLNLRFMAVGKSGSISPILFDRIMFNEGKPSVTAADGKIVLF
jgi:uncharacterized delta-60 repeat protein